MPSATASAVAELVVALRRHPAWRGFDDETKFYRTIMDRRDELKAGCVFNNPN
jgi:hypothetical protein